MPEALIEKLLFVEKIEQTKKEEKVDKKIRSLKQRKDLRRNGQSKYFGISMFGLVGN